MRGALGDAFARAGADLLRGAARPFLDRRCKRCLTATHGDEHSGGLCPTCRETKPHQAKAEAPNDDSPLRRRICEGLQRRTPSRGRYDALLLNSGGKDSLYMLTRLRRTFPDLRFLSVSYDNGFLNSLSLRNIERGCRAQDVDSLIVRPKREIYRELIRRGVEESSAVGCYRVDCMDGAIFRDGASILAVEQNIPLIFAGHTYAQTQTILGFDDFRMPEHLLAADRTEYFGIPVHRIFPDGGDHIWRGASIEPDRLPVWLFPMHLWRPSQREIEHLLQGAGFAPDQVKQYYTGNALQTVFLLHDYRHRGRFSYEDEVALMLRASLVNRSEWRRIYTVLELVARSHRLTRRLAAPPLEQLGLNFDELFTDTVPEAPRGRPRPDARDVPRGARH